MVDQLRLDGAPPLLRLERHLQRVHRVHGVHRHGRARRQIALRDHDQAARGVVVLLRAPALLLDAVQDVARRAGQLALELQRRVQAQLAVGEGLVLRADELALPATRQGLGSGTRLWGQEIRRRQGEGNEVTGL